MEEQIKLPDMGEGVESATVASILVEPGDQVDPEQGIVELETDKAVAEVPCPKAGKVKEIHVEEGQELEPGALLLTLTTGEEESGDESEEQQPRTEKEEEPEEAGEAPAAEKKEEPQEPEEKPAKTEKAKKKPEEKPEKQSQEKKPEPREETLAKKRQRTASSGDAALAAAPSVRRLARELGVDLREIEGSGEGGWITEADVKAAVRKQPRGRAEREAEGERDAYGPIRREKISKIRKTIAKKMTESHSNTVRVTHFADADVTELEVFRKRHKKDFTEEGIELGMLPFVVRSVVDALRRHPIVNASVDWDSGEIIYKDYVSIGLAVDSERGLVVPVLRNTDCLSLAETARALDHLAARVRSGDFEIEDLRGGTFSISNLGSIGGKYATPVINYPESAILLTGRARQMPMVIDGQVAIRNMLPLSLSYDHRIIDGADAGRFLNDVIAFLQDPARLLLR